MEEHLENISDLTYLTGYSYYSHSDLYEKIGYQPSRGLQVQVLSLRPIFRMMGDVAQTVERVFRLQKLDGFYPLFSCTEEVGYPLVMA